MREKLVRRTFSAVDREWPAFDGAQLVLRTPGGYAKNWLLNDRYETTNQTALAIARFIAKFNGYQLVKDPPKPARRRTRTP